MKILLNQIAKNLLSQMIFNVKFNFKEGLFSSIFYLKVPYFAKFHSSLRSLLPTKLRATELDQTSAFMFSTKLSLTRSSVTTSARPADVLPGRHFVRTALDVLSGPFYATFFSARPAWTFCQDRIRSFVRIYQHPISRK